ncbi:(Fe-S)-binding protein [Pelagibaculum spongiae]|nr:(Fe-S)-binding protein [Pelagibaculum spongiae]
MTNLSKNDLDRAANRLSYSTAKKVYLYSSCLVDMFDPQAGISAVKLFERAGIEVIFPMGQSCCGQPPLNSGHADEAKTIAKSQLELLKNPWPVVVMAGSCAATMLHEYPELLKYEPEWKNLAENVSGRLFEFTEFVAGQLDLSIIDVGASVKIALHTSCSARRKLNSLQQGRDLLAKLSNVELVIHDREYECCGFGGTFAIKHGDVSAAMVHDKAISLLDAGIERVVSPDPGCLLNIGGHLEHLHKKENKPLLKVQHVASFLWERISGEQA